MTPISLSGSLQSYDAFRNAIGQRESGDNYGIVNKYGYMGRYQFGLSTLRSLGYQGTKKEFISNHSLHDQYFDMLVQSNAKIVNPYLSKVQARLSNATISGLIAGAHLLGAGGIKKYANTGVDGTDANGTHISSYITQFSGYEIPGYTSGVNIQNIAKAAIPSDLSPVFITAGMNGKNILIIGAVLTAGIAIFYNRKKLIK